MDAASTVLDDNTVTSHIKRIRGKFSALDRRLSQRSDGLRHGLPLQRPQCLSASFLDQAESRGAGRRLSFSVTPAVAVKPC